MSSEAFTAANIKILIPECDVMQSVKTYRYMKETTAKFLGLVEVSKFIEATVPFYQTVRILPHMFSKLSPIK
jgi:hypothetical protein